MRKFLIIFVPAFFALVLGACVSGPDEADSVSAAETAERRGGLPERVVPGDGLGSPGLRGLPGEAEIYLKKLSEAFRSHDREFLISQGEAQYEEELRPQFDEASYLAMLYRAGSYSREPAATPAALPQLEYAEIRGIEYTEWTERGPLLEIRGRLHMENGEPLPCEILLAWRLLEPKIIGFFP